MTEGGHHPRQGPVREADFPCRVPRMPGRTARTYDRGQGHRVRGSFDAGIPDLCRAGYCECPGFGGPPYGKMSQDRFGRHGQPSLLHRRGIELRGRWKIRRGSVGVGGDFREQKHDSVRRAQAYGSFRNPHRYARAHHEGDERERDGRTRGHYRFGHSVSRKERRTEIEGRSDL